LTHLRENIEVALEGIWANRLRSFLTMLGIIIGVSAVIGIVTVGAALATVVSNEIHAMGVRNIQVSVRAVGTNVLQSLSGVAQMPMDDSDRISNDMIEQFRQEYYFYIEAISLSRWLGAGHVGDAENHQFVTAYGVNLDYAASHGLNIVNGRFLNDEDMESGLANGVISSVLAEAMFEDADPVGRELTVFLSGMPFRVEVVGVYEYVAGWEIPMLTISGGHTNIYVPITLADSLSALFGGASGTHQNFVVTIAEDVEQEYFGMRIVRFFNQFYAANSSFHVVASPTSMVFYEVETIMDYIQIAVAVIAGISLIVGGVGVMNIMLVSVTERTREIGTRKALGATSHAIRVQFITEAIILCGIGGVIGTVLGIGMGFLGGMALGVVALPSAFAIIVAVAFSMAIGLFFGLYPANKAAKMNPIEALRHE